MSAQITPACPCPNCGCGLNAKREWEPIDSLDTSSVSAPRIQELLKSNIIPFDTETRPFVKAIDAGAKKLADIDAEISSAHRLLDVLLQHRGEVQADVQRLKSVIGPVRRLPAEILGDMFLSCLNGCIQNDVDWETNCLDSRQMAWPLSHVCAGWRAAAIAYPPLWSTMPILVNRRTLDRKGPESMLTCYIQRSVPNLLFISLTGNSCIPDSHPILNLLLSCCSRWDRLSFHLPKEQNYSIFSSINRNISHLRSFQNLGLSPPDEGGPVRRLDLRSASNLREIKGSFSALLKPFNLPWSQITKLTHRGEGLYASSSLLYLGHMRMLQVCKLTCAHSPMIITEPPLIMEYLHVLHLESAPESRLVRDAFSQLLNRLTLPRLTVLILKSRDPFEPSSIRSLLERSQCSLEELHIDTPMTGGDYFYIATATPSLLRLSMECNEPSTFIDAWSRDTNLLPRLQFLEIVGFTPYPNSVKNTDEILAVMAYRNLSYQLQHVNAVEKNAVDLIGSTYRMD